MSRSARAVENVIDHHRLDTIVIAVLPEKNTSSGVILMSYVTQIQRVRSLNAVEQ